MNEVITSAEYNRRVKYNTKVANEYIKKFGPNGLVAMISQVYTFESKPGEMHISTLIKNAYDIIPAVMLGYLPCIAPNGADAIELVDGKCVEIEFKWTTTYANRYWVSNVRKPVIYTGRENTATRRACHKSQICGKFQIHTDKCADSKKRKTILLVSEGDMPECVILDAFELDAETTHRFVSGVNNRGEKRTGKNRQIKLNTFMKHGYSIKHKSIVDDGIRFQDYETLLHNNLPSLKEHLAGKRYKASFQELLQVNGHFAINT